MDLGKNSKFFSAYGDMWSLMKKYCDSNSMVTMREFVKEAREMEKKYPEYQDFVGSSLYHYGKLIEKEIMENGSGSQQEMP